VIVCTYEEGYGRVSGKSPFGAFFGVIVQLSMVRKKGR